MSKNVHISVVSPVYRGAEMVEELVRRISESVSQITQDFEIILVEDGSPDRSWEEIEKQCAKDSRVKGIKLSRNFGQYQAMAAGLQAAQGEWVIPIDCDLQDTPESIITFYQKATQEDYDAVIARRVGRTDGFFRRWVSKNFHAILGFLTGTKQDSSINHFGIYRKCVIDTINLITEHNRYFPTMVQWVGFKQCTVPVKHAERAEGETSYNFSRLFNLALDIILSYSDKPLRLMVATGGAVALLAVIFGSINIVLYFLNEIEVPGYASIIVSIWFFAGLIILMLGILGLYLGKVFEETKGRPIFITEKQINITENP